MNQPFLLHSQQFEVTNPPVCLDFQARVGHPVESPCEAVPGVLVLTRSADTEVDDLSLHLAAKGVPLVRIDSDRCPGTPFSWDPLNGTLDLGHVRLMPAVVWLRYFTAASIPSTGDMLTDAYRRTQWSGLATSLAASSSHSTVNAGFGLGHPDRLHQLVAASELGIRVPATIVTTSPGDAARGLPGRGRVIVKSLADHYLEPTPGNLRGLFPQVVSRDQLPSPNEPDTAPVLVQEFVAARKELRIFAVGDELLGFAVTKRSADALWREPADVEVRSEPVDPVLTAALKKLQHELGLDVAAFDLLDTTDGPVFLEANVNCDWRWCEAAAGTDTVSTAVRRLLIEMYEGASLPIDQR